MHLKVLATAVLVGGLGLASTADAAPLAPAPAGVVAGDATVSKAYYYGRPYGYYRPIYRPYGFYRPRPFYRPYGFYRPWPVYRPYGFYRPRPFYRPYGFYGPRRFYY